MFKGKIFAYQNIDGKEKRFEREFSDYESYKSFLNSNSHIFPSIWPSYNFGLEALDNYLNNFLDSKLEIAWPENTSNEIETDWLNLSKYEKEAMKIDEEKRQKEYKKTRLENTKKTLNSYLEKFKKEKREDLVKDIEEDLSKVESWLKELA